MLITRTSMATGITRTLDLPVTEAQLAAFSATQGLIQDIFPQLSDSDREFILTGMTDEEWDEIYADYANMPYERSLGVDDGSNDIPF